MTEPRRVLCLTSNYPRWVGDSTTPFVHHLARDLAGEGYVVDVLAPHAPGAATDERLAGVRVERFRYVVPEAAETVCYGGGAMVNLRKRPLERLKLPALVAAEWWATWSRLVTRRYDVIHSHWVLPQGFVAMLASTLPRVPHVATVHGGDLFSLQGGLLDALKARALRSAAAVTVNSSFTAAAVERIAPGLPALHRIPMGVDDTPLSAAEQGAAAQVRARERVGDGPLLVFVGRLVDEKGGEDALRALALLRRDHPNARLLVIGDGQDRPALEALAGELGLGAACHFVGWLSQAEVRAHLAAADVFVGPSRTGPDGWVEAQGLTFLEAMAVGTPVVATKLGGIVDSVVDGETGLLVPERSPEQLARAVRRLVADAPLARSLAVRAEQLVRERFSRRASARAFAQVFDGVVARPRRVAVPAGVG